ncbi:sigma-70 family RNA polymerase sigma factor [Candidatus Roizmanbacteria bacterium]|nr:sigma-70 family RNA polymerase sigma factor [Candidatus Roizmanbacteria bacterium]
MTSPEIAAQVDQPSQNTQEGITTKLPTPLDQYFTLEFGQRLRARQDEEAWIVFYEGTKPYCLNLLHNKGIAGALAEDVYQEAVTKFYKCCQGQLVNFDTNPQGYFLKLVVNKGIDELRKGKHSGPSLSEFADSSDQGETALSYLGERPSTLSQHSKELTDVEGGVLRKIDTELINAAINELPDADNRTIVRLWMAGIESKEIARLIEIPDSTVRTRIHRAKKILYGLLRRNKIFYDSEEGNVA